MSIVIIIILYYEIIRDYIINSNDLDLEELSELEISNRSDIINSNISVKEVSNLLHDWLGVKVRSSNVDKILDSIADINPDFCQNISLS